MENNLKILMYHYVDNDLIDPMCVPEDSFAEQIKFLHDEGYYFLNMKDVNDIIFNNKKFEKAVLIIFDDGYKNTFAVALPILQKYNARAAVAVCGSYINEETCVKPTIHCSQEYGDVDDINKWLASGNDIAGHTYSHKKLSHLTEAEVRKEVELDNLVLLENFNTDIDCFVYPFGSVNDLVEKIVAEKYKFAFVTTEGFSPSYDNRYRMKRIYVRPEWNINDFIGSLNNSN